ncbi:hypothetical protein [Candidatus Chloroploca asiatica]|uniref:Uncharacterized protein n=1 Tax=Candidatus Chloroploca asiatica TaxID=1506545 RepID=A0A2H3KYY5_9CHLR|nr:hypothetical protein [Candidatus Chloroploca asiatica]PDW00845.1 hypothetical protein A9Q02_08230 [Candidatus Chloroploca asiatica]
MPTWLRELKAEVAEDETTRTSLPEADAWLSDFADPQAGQPTLSADEPPFDEQAQKAGVKLPSGATDWLVSMGQDLAEPDETTAEPPTDEDALANEGIPDWLRDLTEEEVARAIEAEVSDPSLEPTRFGAEEPSLDVFSPPPPSEQPVARGAPRKPLPDWLLPPEPESPEPGPRPERKAGDEAANLAASAEIPAWLRDIAEESPSTPTTPVDEVPGWLQEADAGYLPDSSAELFEQAETDDVPDWLRDDVPSEPPAPPQAEVSDLPDWLTSEPAQESATDLDVPTWLRGDEAGEGAVESSTEVDVPTWLRGDEAKAPAADDRATDLAVPDWLRDDQQAPDDEPDADAEVMPAWLQDLERSPPASSLDPADVPTWLREAEARAESDEADGENQPDTDAQATVSDVPTWLREAHKPADEPSDTDWEAGSVAEGEQLGEAAAWLADASADSGPPEASQPPEDVEAWLRDEDIPPVETPAWLSKAETPSADDQVPEWLREDLAEATRADAAQADDVLAWLQDEPATPAAATPDWLSESDDASEEIPAWLREDAPAAEVKSPTDADIPTWLREAIAPVEASLREEALQASGEVAEPDAEMPSWLREAASADDDSDEKAPADWQAEAEPAPPPPGGMPAWLEDVDAEPAEPFAPAAQHEAQPAAPPPGGMPAWLEDVDAEPAEPFAPAAQHEAQPAAPPPGGMPAWLEDVDAEPAEPFAPAAQHEAQPAAPPPDGMPAWLEDVDEAPADSAAPAWLQTKDEAPGKPPVDDAPAWLRDETGATTSAGGGALSSSEVPPWLQDEEDEAGLSSDKDAKLAPWLRGLGNDPESPQIAEPLANLGTAESESNDDDTFLEGAELPRWLRPSESERLVRPSDSEPATQLDWLKRLGIVDSDSDSVNIVEPIIEQGTHRPTTVRKRSEQQLTDMALLASIVASPYPEPVAPAEPLPLTRWQRIGVERILYSILVVALLVALIFPGITTPLQSEVPISPEVAELGMLLDGLGDEDVVLVAYEWAAQRSAELRPLEGAVMQRLMANRTKLILVSTDLQGTLLSFDLIEPLREAGYNNENGIPLGGRDYVLLGYRPGGDLALRQLAQDFRGQLQSDFDGNDASQSLVANNPDGTPRISTLDDLAMILVLADEAQDVQAWMEQVHRAAPAVPITFLLPNEAQPLAQPYLRLPKVYHLAGQQGALALLSTDADSDSATIAATTGQLSFAVVVFLVLLAGGVLISLGTRPGRPKGDDS